MEYLWKLESGTAPNLHYGLALAEAVQFPEDVVERARVVVAALDSQAAVRAAAAAAADGAEEGGCDHAAWEVVGKLWCLTQALGSSDNDEALLRQVRALQEEAAEELR